MIQIMCFIKVCIYLLNLNLFFIGSSGIPDCKCVNPQDCELPAKYNNMTVKIHYCGRNEDGTDRVCCLTYDDAILKTTPPPKTKKNSTAIAQSYCEQYSKYATDCVYNDEPPMGEMKPALLKEFPHIAVVASGSDVNNISWSRTGSLISERFIFSEQHSETEESAKWAFLGYVKDNRTMDDGPGRIYDIEREYVHPDFDFPRYTIALYKLKTPVEFNSYIRPACLYTSNSDQINERLKIASWGPFDLQKRSRAISYKIKITKLRFAKRTPVEFHSYTRPACLNTSNSNQVIKRRKITDSGQFDPPKLSPVLQKTSLTVVDHQQCLQFAKHYDPNTMACAGSNSDYPVILTWSGEGSQLQMRGNESCVWTIFASYNSYSQMLHRTYVREHLFTKVSPILDWIQSIVWP